MVTSEDIKALKNLPGDRIYSGKSVGVNNKEDKEKHGNSTGKSIKTNS